ncbi:hemicentin-1 [Trichonephila clavata]|uniref:Hemicentin-1 n=1 Tax=Trichonephila clavata TaxID=2740835 RepID=A0A8X6GI73_TRICU|nr:hemicentin-1 [Trichonephila clavata]
MEAVFVMEKAKNHKNVIMQNAQCMVNGEIGMEWSLCSSSCGGGTRERKRKCDSPFPAYGGHYCIGQHVQIDYCNNAECPGNA